MSELMTTICNSIIAILTALSQFDIMAVDNNKLAVAAEVMAYCGRAVYHIIRMIEIIAVSVK